MMIRSTAVRPFAGLVITAVGCAHFGWPAAFERVNRTLGFTRNTRLNVFVNGGIETALGVTLLSERTRYANIALSVCYPAYLMLNALRARSSDGAIAGDGPVTPG